MKTNLKGQNCTLAQLFRPVEQRDGECFGVKPPLASHNLYLWEDETYETKDRGGVARHGHAGFTSACSGGGSGSSSAAPESSAPAETSSAAEESTASEAGEESSAAGRLPQTPPLTYDGEEVTITYWHTHSDQEAEVLTEQIIP